MGGIGPAGPIVGDSEQQFALKWNDYHTSILNSFKVLRDQKDFIDVTIACDNMSFNAHKVVLSACSPYFRSLLKANPCQHPIVILHNVREHDMEALLRFMYNGEVHIGQEQLPDFLRTATALQVRGLADVSPKNRQNLSNIHAVPWSTGDENNSQSLYNSKHNLSVDNLPPSKKHRTSENPDSRYSESPPVNRDSGSENADGKPSSLSDSVLSQSQGDVSQSAQNSHAVLKTVSEPSSQVQSSNEEESDYDDEASDAEVDNGHSSISDLAQASDFAMNERSRNDALSSGLYDQQRQRSNFPLPFNLQNLSDIAGLIPGLSGMHNNSQDSYGLMRRNSETGKVRATDPRPCPKCGKIYRSAHTLRTHLEDKHTVCPGYRCVLCGTVAKSRNSLHSHMSRQHRGISTKDLPVVPMPSNFDPELAAMLYKKAGIKMTAAELRARASPTGIVSTPIVTPRRSEGKTGMPSSPEEDEDKICHGMDLTMSSSNNFHSQEPLPLDFRHSSVVNNKLNTINSLLMSSFIPLSAGVDKENMDST